MSLVGSKASALDEIMQNNGHYGMLIVNALVRINLCEYRCRSYTEVSTEMGDRVRVQFPVPDIYFSM